jgi:hypothetical protein
MQESATAATTSMRIKRPTPYLCGEIVLLMDASAQGEDVEKNRALDRPLNRPVEAFVTRARS